MPDNSNLLSYIYFFKYLMIDGNFHIGVINQTFF